MKPDPLTRKPLVQCTCTGRMKFVLPPDPAAKKVLLLSPFTVKPHPRTQQHHSLRLHHNWRLAKKKNCASTLTGKTQPPVDGVLVCNSRQNYSPSLRRNYRLAKQKDCCGALTRETQPLDDSVLVCNSTGIWVTGVFCSLHNIVFWSSIARCLRIDHRIH